jgi:hypothetical protein
MPRTPAKVNQGDIARCARVAKELGDGWVVEVTPDGTIRIIQHPKLDTSPAAGARTGIIARRLEARREHGQD